jgi:peptidoglycan/LPS O-acetylase OafA/YrhL
VVIMTASLRIPRRIALLAITVLVSAASSASFAESYRGLFLWALHQHAPLVLAALVFGRSLVAQYQPGRERAGHDRRERDGSGNSRRQHRRLPPRIAHGWQPPASVLMRGARRARQ